MVYIIYYNGLLRDVPATARPTNPVTRAYLCVGKKRERTERRGKGRKEVQEEEGDPTDRRKERSGVWCHNFFSVSSLSLLCLFSLSLVTYEFSPYFTSRAAGESRNAAYLSIAASASVSPVFSCHHWRRETARGDRCCSPKDACSERRKNGCINLY